MRRPDASSWRRLGAELAVAWRYLRSARDDALIHQLSRITVAGLALGVAALILALSALTGFQEHLLDDVLSHSPTLQLGGLDPESVGAARARIESLDGVLSAQEIREGRGWLRRRGDIRPVEIVSYQRRPPAWLHATFARVPADGDPTTAAGILVPEPVLRAFGVQVGDVVELVTPRRTFNPLGGQMPSSRRLRVVGTLTGSRVDEVAASRVALPLSLGRGILHPGASTLDLELVGDAELRRLSGSLREELAGFAETAEGRVRVTTWRERHGALLFVLRLEKFAVFLSVALIVLVASFALVSALALILSNKRSELGLLAAVGMSRRRLRRMFLLLGSMFAATGALAGGALGASIAWTLDRFEVLRLPRDVYVVDHVPFSLRAEELLAVLGATVILTLVAAFFGARGATQWTPVEALRR